MFEEWKDELQLEVAESEEDYEIDSLLSGHSLSPLGKFYERWGYTAATLVIVFKAGKKKFALIDITNPRFYRVYDQFVGRYDNCWLYANTALMSVDKAEHFFSNVSKHKDYPVKVRIT